MRTETENDRVNRIRKAQLHDRSSSRSRNPYQNVSVKKKSVSKQANKSSQTPIPSLLHLPLGGVRDVMIGLTYGLIPTILAAFLLPGALKLVALVILVIAGVVGYMAGAPTS